MIPLPVWNRPFDEELLSSSIEDRCEFFKTARIDHPILDRVKVAILEVIKNPNKVSILLIIGPMRVGKTWLIDDLCDALTELSHSDPKFHIGRLPFGRQSAKPPTGSKFDFQYFFRDGLIIAKETLIDFKLEIIETDFCTDDGKNVLKLNIKKDTLLRNAFCNMLKNRDPYAWLLDEAQDIGWALKVSERRANMDVIKDVSNTSKTLFILLGTHNLINMDNISGQIAGRSQTIDFPRYKAHIPEDIVEFKKLIKTLQRHMPLKEEPNLVKHYKLLYEGCNGLIGLLKLWLGKVLWAVISDKTELITEDVLRKHMLPATKLLNMLDKIERGELSLADTEAAKAELNRRQNRDPEDDRENLIDQQDHSINVDAKPRRNKAKSAGGGNPKPGVRNPKRDPVGRKGSK